MLKAWTRGLAIAIVALGVAACEDDDDDFGSANERAAGALTAANDSELALSLFGLERGVDSRVLAYAQRMFDEHVAARTRLESTTSAAGIRPTVAPTSQRVINTMENERAELAVRQPGQDFDVGFMCSQARMHDLVIDLLVTDVEPAVEDDSLRTLVGGLRPGVQAHLEDALALLRTMTSSEPTAACQSFGGL